LYHFEQRGQRRRFTGNKKKGESRLKGEGGGLRGGVEHREKVGGVLRVESHEESKTGSKKVEQGAGDVYFEVREGRTSPGRGGARGVVRILVRGENEEYLVAGEYHCKPWGNDKRTL